MKSHDWTTNQTEQASIPNYGKKYVDEPNYLNLIGCVKNKKVLELGSGNGYWLELLTKKGAECTGIELSDNQINLSKSKDTSKSINYIKGDITKSINLKFETFDIILINHVLLEIDSIEKILNIFKTCYQLLKLNGRIVISELHPFATSSRPKNIKLPHNFNYFNSGQVFEIISHRIDGEDILYKDFHWTLSDVISSITSNGLVVSKIIEPKPNISDVTKYDALKYRLTTPMSIMIEVKKPSF